MFAQPKSRSCSTKRSVVMLEHRNVMVGGEGVFGSGGSEAWNRQPGSPSGLAAC
jgi:hypothetical protein